MAGHETGSSANEKTSIDVDFLVQALHGSNVSPGQSHDDLIGAAIGLGRFGNVGEDSLGRYGKRPGSADHERTQRRQWKSKHPAAIGIPKLGTRPQPTKSSRPAGTKDQAANVNAGHAVRQIDRGQDQIKILFVGHSWRDAVQSDCRPNRRPKNFLTPAATATTPITMIFQNF